MAHIGKECGFEAVAFLSFVLSQNKLQRLFLPEISPSDRVGRDSQNALFSRAPTSFQHAVIKPQKSPENAAQ